MISKTIKPTVAAIVVSLFAVVLTAAPLSAVLRPGLDTDESALDDCDIPGQVTIWGTEGNDRIYGTEGRDVIHGLGGNDRIFGLGGDDSICGGDGRDYLNGGDGNDTLWGGDANDRLYGMKGRDRLFGEGGRDRLLGGKGDDQLWGGRGLDRYIAGQGGADQVWQIRFTESDEPGARRGVLRCDSDPQDTIETPGHCHSPRGGTTPTPDPPNLPPIEWELIKCGRDEIFSGGTQGIINTGLALDTVFLSGWVTNNTDVWREVALRRPDGDPLRETSDGNGPVIDGEEFFTFPSAMTEFWVPPQSRAPFGITSNDDVNSSCVFDVLPTGRTLPGAAMQTPTGPCDLDTVPAFQTHSRFTARPSITLNPSLLDQSAWFRVNYTSDDTSTDEGPDSVRVTSVVLDEAGQPLYVTRKSGYARVLFRDLEGVGLEGNPGTTFTASTVIPTGGCLHVVTGFDYLAPWPFGFTEIVPAIPGKGRP